MAIVPYHLSQKRQEAFKNIKSGSTDFKLPDFESYLCRVRTVTVSQLRHYLERLDTCFSDTRAEKFSQKVIHQLGLSDITRTIKARGIQTVVARCLKREITNLKEDESQSVWEHIYANEAGRSVEDVRKSETLRADVEARKDKPVQHFSYAALKIYELTKKPLFGWKKDYLPTEIGLHVLKYLDPVDIANLSLAQGFSTREAKQRIFENFRLAEYLNISGREKIINAFRQLFPESPHTSTAFLPALTASVNHISTLQLPGGTQGLAEVANALTTEHRRHIKQIFFDTRVKVVYQPDTDAVLSLLKDLPALETLTLNVANCNDTVLEALSRLPSLKTLTLRHSLTSQTGPTPEGLEVNIPKLEHLTTLTLINFPTITGVHLRAVMLSCTNLKTLQVISGSQKFHAINFIVSDLTLLNLEGVVNTSLENVLIDGYAFFPSRLFQILSKNTALKTVSFEACRFLEQPDNLPFMPNLEAFYMSESFVEGIAGVPDPFNFPAFTKAAPSLASLEVSYPTQENAVSYLNLEDVQRSHRLTYLNLKAQQFELTRLFELLALFPGVKTLDCSENGYFRRSLENGKFEKVDHVEVAHGRFEERRRVHGLTSLNLQSCNLDITKELLMSLHHTFPALTKLKLGMNILNYHAFDQDEEAVTFVNIEHLDISSAKWLDNKRVRKVLKLYPNLKKLDVGNAKITGICFKPTEESATSHHDLEEIDLSANPVTEAGIDAIVEGCPNIKVIRLTGAHISMDREQFKEVCRRYPKVTFNCF
ncbi:MAG: hypothetical protein S4CHLAM37_16210 [Chlamydiia bacterium]|nr:hypothetical protein [Chlamydiia bacterium]